jgi:membrane protease YdiL (CAAX protease family)
MKKNINVKKIVLFLLLTFGLTWGFELLIALTITQASYLKTGLHPAGMFFPAFSALILQIFVFKDSSLYYRRNKDKTRWIFYSFLILTVLNVLVNVLALITQFRVLILQGISGILVMLWTLLIFYFYGKSGPEGFQKVGLQLGKIDLGVRFILGVILFLFSQAVLNWLFGLGKFPGNLHNIGGIPTPDGLYPVALIAFFLISVIGIPLSGLATLFGEEYGWRGFLHDELVKLGPRPGIFLVGLIWGIWHFPIILSGIHTYPPTVNGLILGLLFFILAGFVLGYAVMKTHSIWVVSFMHGVLNSIYAFVITYIFRPSDKVFSFGLGLYGLICLAGIVFLIFRDPVWHAQFNKVQKVNVLR